LPAQAALANQLFKKWRSRFGGIEASDAAKLRDMNSQLASAPAEHKINKNRVEFEKNHHQHSRKRYSQAFQSRFS
jgi:hypothetical protein